MKPKTTSRYLQEVSMGAQAALAALVEDRREIPDHFYYEGRRDGCF